ncbi:MAG: Gfo/Idh/MocA family oxidoreductase [Candidatus Latescibacterota bacterium]
MEKSNRRRFLRTAALAGSAAAAGKAASAAPAVRRTSVELLNVGVVGVGEYSHIPTIWGPTINPDFPETWPMRTTRMRISHCWDRDPQVAADFAKKYQCEVVKNYYDMTGRVDGMVFGSFFECPWWPQLTKPYLEAGIPCFINRPFAFSMKDAREMVETARKHNTPILCTDSQECIKEVQVARWKVEQLLKEGKTILGVNSDNDGSEYPAHGVHGIYFLLAALGVDVEQASFQSDGWWSDNNSGTPKMNWGVLNLQFSGIKIEGAGEQKRPFVASQHILSGQGANTGLRIYYRGGWWDISSEWEQGERFNRTYQYFFPTVLAIQRMFETRKMQWSYDYILDKTRIFLTAFKSNLEHGGAMIRVADLPEDWKAPTPRPNWIDESIF